MSLFTWKTQVIGHGAIGHYIRKLIKPWLSAILCQTGADYIEKCLLRKLIALKETRVIKHDWIQLLSFIKNYYTQIVGSEGYVNGNHCIPADCHFIVIHFKRVNIGFDLKQISSRAIPTDLGSIQPPLLTKKSQKIFATERDFSKMASKMETSNWKLASAYHNP